MGLIQAYKMAIKSILSNKVRSLLTMLGVIIGVAAVISAVAFAEGSTKNITDSISSLGTDLIQITINGRNNNRDITYEDLQNFADANSEDILALTPQVTSPVTVKSGVNSMTTSLIGTSPDYESIKNVHVSSGRFLMTLDVDLNQKVALIGTAVANELYEGRNPVGESIKINGYEFKIVGLLTQKEDGTASSEDDKVLVPVTVSKLISKNARIRNFAVQATDAKHVDSAVTKLKALLATKYSDEKSYRVFNQSQMLSTLSTVTNTQMLLLGGIAAISLVVGGIGIMNIMLVSVTERTREIGIRKAIGAKRRSILVQFLIEALMLTGFGGISGVLIGCGIIHFVISKFGGVPEVYSVFWMVASFGISLAVGVAFGSFPAYKASSLNPIEALRHE